jgi:hypothetical protein
MKRLATLSGAFLAALLLPGAAPAPSGVGTDVAADKACLGCHAAAIGDAWSHPNSHERLLGCRGCHATTAASGKGHATSPACAKCHSQKGHGAAPACATCHDVHGSDNAFLVRLSVTTPAGKVVPLHVTKPEGATPDGLVRRGVAGATAGTGTCEVCHATTSVYDAAGKGAAHSPRWCAECHRHEAGFAAPQ